MSRPLEQEAQNDARPALAEEREHLHQALITFTCLLAELPGHAVSVARPGSSCRNLQKVSYPW